MVGWHELASTGMFMSKLCAYFGFQTRWTRLGAAWLNIDSTGRPSKQESWVSIPGLCINLGANFLSVFPSYTGLFLVRQEYWIHFRRPREGFALSLLHFLASSSLKRSKFGKKTGCEGGVADIFMETVQSYDDPLKATSLPGLIKVTARPEPEGGHLIPGMEAEVAKKQTRGAKSGLLLHYTWLWGKQCERQEFKQASLIGNLKSRQLLPFVTAHMPFPSSARFYLYRSKESNPRLLSSL